MLQTPRLKRSGVSLTLTLVLVGLGLPSFAPSFARVAPKPAMDAQNPQIVPPTPIGSAYRQTNLVSDVPGVAFIQDPLLWGFFGTPFNDNNPNDQVVIPFTTGVGGQVNGKWDAPEGNNTTLAAQLSNLREGRAYVNFHTTQFPGGEVRGNIPAATSFRDALVAGLNASPATETRATVLRKIAEAEELGLREFNSAFVLMEYFGYLRRDPDVAGFTFWLNKLNAFNGDFRAAEMVKAFIASSEYRQRFGAN